MNKQTATTEPKSTPAKSASITLRAGAATLMLLATLKANGSIVTTVTTRDADKKLSKGMTQTFTSMDEAKKHLATLAAQAEKLGWKRGTRIVAARPDAFSKLPTAPKAVAQS